MLGKKELQDMLAQKESVIAQREAEIAVLTKRVEELTSREARMSAEMETYRARSEAIVGALTEAQQAAARIRDDAENQKAQIVAAAYTDRDAARREAEAVLQNAREQASKVIARAEGEGMQRRSHAEAQAAEAEKKALYFRDYVRKAAEEVRLQAETFGSFMADMNSAGTGLRDVPQAALPQDYESPAELMHNIYSIQGRELPQESPTLQETDLHQHQVQPEPKPEAKRAPLLDWNALMAEAAGTTASPADQESQAEEQVISVNDIIASGTPASQEFVQPAGVPDGLDAIIDDILRGI